MTTYNAPSERTPYTAATAHGPLSQRSFLLNMGIGARVDALRRAAVSSDRADALGKAVARLVDPVGMGRQYKVMGVTGGREVEEVWPFIAGEVVAQDAPTGKGAERHPAMPAA